MCQQILDPKLFSQSIMLECCSEMYIPQSQQTLHHQQITEFALEKNIGGLSAKIHPKEIVLNPGHHLLYQMGTLFQVYHVHNNRMK